MEIAEVIDKKAASEIAPGSISVLGGMLLTCGPSDLRMSFSHQAPALMFKTTQILCFHRELSPSFCSFPPVLRHSHITRRHFLVSSPPPSIANGHVDMSVASFGHINTGFQGFLSVEDACKKPKGPRFEQESFRNRQGELQKPLI